MEFEQEPQFNIWEANPKLKTLLVILIFTFLFSGIALVVYSQWGNSLNAELQKEIMELPRHNFDQWETYTDSASGYQLSYPKNWAAESTDTGSVFNPKDLYNSQYEHDYVFEIDPVRSISSALDGRASEVCPNITDVQISGLSAIFCKSDELGITTYYYRITDITGIGWKKDNMISFTLPNVHEELLPTYEKILNSIKITRKTTATELKTYHSEDLNFDIQYPNDWELTTDVTKIHHDFTFANAATKQDFSFSGEDNPNNKVSPADFIRTGYEDQDKVTGTQIQFNGYLAYQLSSKNPDIDGAILIFHNNTVYTFPKPDESNKAILDSFKFTK